MVIDQYDVYLVNLDPTIGKEIRKTRPCLIVSPNEMNHNIGTIILAPMTTKSHQYPSRGEVDFGGKNGWIMLDQIRCIDKKRLVKKLGKIGRKTIVKTKGILKEMLVD